MRESPVRGPAVDLGEFERRMRGPEPRGPGKVDPLSELARLMGNEGEVDPYGDILPDPRAPRAHAQPAAPAEPPWLDQLRGSFEAAPPVSVDPRQYPEHQAQPPRYQTEDYGAAYRPHAEPHPQHEPAYHDQGYQDQGYDDQGYADQQQYDAGYHGGAEGGWSDDSQYLDYGAEEAPESGKGRDWGGLLKPWHAIAAISVIAVASIGWGFAHRSGAGGSKEIAVINAPEGPVKVKPTAEADQEAPDASSAAVLDRKEPSPVKQVVTHSEQAVDPAVAPKAVRLGNGPVDAPHEPPLAPQPKKVKTVTVRPDGSRVDDAALPPAVVKSSAPPAEPGASRGNTPKPEARPVTSTQAAKPKAPKVAAVEPPVADDAAAPAASAAGGYAVQFGAANSEDEARALLKTVAAKYGVKPTFKPAKVGDRTVYRVRVAGVSKDSANAICNKVKAAGGSCFVAGN